MLKEKLKKIFQPVQMASRITPAQFIHNGFYQIAKNIPEVEKRDGYLYTFALVAIAQIVEKHC